MNWKFEIIQDWDIIWSESHQARWLQHMEAAENAHVFFHPALVKAWVETYIPLRKLSPLFVWASCGESVVMLPLVLWCKDWKGAFMRTVVPCGYSDYDYHDPIVANLKDKQQLSIFWLLLRSHLRGMLRFDSMEIDGIHENYAPEWINRENKEACPFINLAAFSSIDDYQATLSSKLRGDLRRVMRRLQELGEVNIHTYSAEDIETAMSDLPRLLELHRLRWPNAYKAPCFHANLIRLGLTAGVMHFTKVSVDNTPISWIIAFVYKGSYYFWMPTMNPDYTKCSPGKVNLQFCIQYALEKGLDKYDHLRGDELYKSKLTDCCDFVYSAIVYEPSLLCLIKQALLKIKAKLLAR